MVNRQALRVLIKPRERSTLVIWFDTFHFDNFSPREHVSELNRGSAFLLILYDLEDVLFDGVALGDGLVVSITLVSVLVTT